MISILIILVILLIITVLLFVPIVFEYAFSYDGNMKSSFVVRFLIFKNDFRKNGEKKPQRKEKKPKEKKSISRIIEDVKYYKRLFLYFKNDIFLILKYAKEKTIKIKSLNFDISFAGKDAMQTGVYTGIVNGTVYNAVSVIDNLAGVDEWSVNVEPDFHKPAFIDAKIHCILNTKLAHIIVVLSKFLLIYLKYRRKRKEI